MGLRKLFVVPESAIAECLLVKVNELQDKVLFDKEICEFLFKYFLSYSSSQERSGGTQKPLSS